MSPVPPPSKRANRPPCRPPTCESVVGDAGVDKHDCGLRNALRSVFLGLEGLRWDLPGVRIIAYVGSGMRGARHELQPQLYAIPGLPLASFRQHLELLTQLSSTQRPVSRMPLACRYRHGVWCAAACRAPCRAVSPLHAGSPDATPYAS